jgi:hypothetical protein
MLVAEEVNHILYSMIENMWKGRIRPDIASNTNLSEIYFDLIMTECIEKINGDPSTSNKDQTIACLRSTHSFYAYGLNSSI